MRACGAVQVSSFMSLLHDKRHYLVAMVAATIDSDSIVFLLHKKITYRPGDFFEDATSMHI
jgi:hypothetical protein